MRKAFPFSAIVGQTEMKQALLMAAVEPRLGGVMVFGDRGTGKSTAVRALAALLPPMMVVPGCRYSCAPADSTPCFEGCRARAGKHVEQVPVPFIDLPLGATEDRVVGSGNPEEGELRPQLLDRFGLSVDVRTPTDIADRIEIVKRCDAFDRHPEEFCERFETAEADVLNQIATARKKLPKVDVPDSILELGTRLCQAVGADGLRGELTLLRAARATAALAGKKHVHPHHVGAVAALALRHRMRKNVLDDTGSTARIDRAVAELIPA